MKIAIFIDGKNFYKGFEKHARGGRINFPRLATWLVEQAGGTLLVGAHYYTGIEPSGSAVEEGAVRLDKFLRVLEMQRGYFVHEFMRKPESQRCPSCDAEHFYTVEKEVDTTIVADMLRMAAVGAFDALVLVSGDADLAPAVEGVRSLGKLAFVASWGGHGLAPRIRRASFDHIDLLTGVATFNDERTTLKGPEEAVTKPAPDAVSEAALDQLFLTQLRLAESHFRSGGFVGQSYFLRNWKAEGFTESEGDRLRALTRLLAAGKVESYDTPEGHRALKSAMV